MSTTERLGVYAVEDSPGVFSLHVQRGDTNDLGTIDKALGHVHVEDFVKGNALVVTTGTSTTKVLDYVQMIPGTMLARGATGDIAALKPKEIGEFLGTTTGATFPTPLPFSQGIVHRHFYTGSGMFEWFYYDDARVAWISERIIPMQFASTASVPENGFVDIVGLNVTTTYGLQSTDDLMLCGIIVNQDNSINTDSIGVRVHRNGVAVATFAVANAENYQGNAAKAKFPSGGKITMQILSGKTGSWFHATLFFRRYFV